VEAEGVDKASLALAALTRFYRTPLATEVERHLTESPGAAALALFRSSAANMPGLHGFSGRRRAIRELLQAGRSWQPAPATDG
jgi:hypothetical protein